MSTSLPLKYFENKCLLLSFMSCSNIGTGNNNYKGSDSQNFTSGTHWRKTNSFTLLSQLECDRE